MGGKRVVGVSCEIGDTAPIVVLKGSGEAADAVLEAARDEEELLVVRASALVDQLYRVPIDAPIGRELYPVMAVLLAHVLLADRKVKELQR